eukprot:scaffold30556_cov50-Phaeocystis_antarctica.AAC.1
MNKCSGNSIATATQNTGLRASQRGGASHGHPCDPYNLKYSYRSRRICIFLASFSAGVTRPSSKRRLSSTRRS